MGRYGYGSKWSSGKGSVSGWETSHYGGFTRVLTDYPYIKMPFELEIEAEDAIKEDLGQWLGDKLIKLYVLKSKELDLIRHFDVTTTTKKSFFGKESEYSIISLRNEAVFGIVCQENAELAPMFENFREGILGSYLEMEIKDEEGDEEGKGKREGEEGEENEEEAKSKGEGEGEGEPSDGRATTRGKTIRDYIQDVAESKPVSYKDSVCKFDEPVKFVSFASRIKKESVDPYVFTPKEVVDSEALIKLLDISFDPKNDVVKNLKMGKLDVAKLAEVTAGNISVYKQDVEDQVTKPFSVCVLGDMSGSMRDGIKVQAQKRIMNMLYLALRDILPHDKLYIYGHSGGASPEVYTFYTPYDREYEKNIRFYENVPWCENYDGPVIEEIHKKIREKTEDHIIFISLSDGEPAGHNYGSDEDVQDLKRILEKARRDSFVTVGIGLEADHVSQLYTYSKAVWDLKDLPKIVSGIVNQVVRTEFK